MKAKYPLVANSGSLGIPVLGAGPLEVAARNCYAERGHPMIEKGKPAPTNAD